MGWSSHDLMEVALRAATLSPDPSTQNGAVLATPAGKALLSTTSCNEFPQGVQYTEDRWERPLKYSVIEHAERNAIFAAARGGLATEGLILVCPWAACSDCARAIIQAGLIELVTLAPNEAATHARWDDSISIAMTMLSEAGVEVTYLDGKEFSHVEELRRDGKPWKP